MQRDEVNTPDETELLQFFHTFMQEGTAKATPNQSERQQHDEDDGRWEKLQEQDGDEESSAGSSMESNTESIPSSSDRSTTDNGETKADTKTESPELTGTTQRRSTHYQMRQRQELDYLKGKVRELERTLCRLENDSGGNTGMWQRVAQQQQRASNRAVAENAQLRTMVAAQLKFSQALEKVLRKRPLFGGGEQPDTRGLPRRKILTAESLCRELKARVIHEHGLFEHVLDESGVAAISTDHHSYDIKVRADPHVPGRTQLRVEWVSVRRMPFAFSAVSREIWGFLRDSSQLDKVSGIARKVETAAEELFTTTTFVFPVGERSASLHQYGAVHRTVSSEWDGFNWVTQGDCHPRRGAKEFFQISEKGWMKISPLDNPDDGCIIHSISHFTPSVLGNPTTVAGEQEASTIDANGSEDIQSLSHSEEVGVLTELICSEYDKSLGLIYSVVQNRLMEQALQQRS